MTGQSYAYFDESYYQDGSKRGTAYVNYRQFARESPIFREIAWAIREIFQPRRVLDVGCATGSIVRWLNELGCEAHGIDVSEWAVQNAEHPNVRRASADNLPYSDGSFDLVISCHSMEHLPDAVLDKSLAEIIRVGSGFFFHMLPMIGTPPYEGEPEIVRRELRKDPTHQQLHEKEWWMGRFERLGAKRVNTCVLLKNETPTAELSIGQFLLKKNEAVPDKAVLSRCAERNQRIFRDLQLARMQQSHFHQSQMGRLSYMERIWKDVERRTDESESLNLAGTSLHLVAIVSGKSCALRIAAGRDSGVEQYAHVGEFHITAATGANVFTFSTDQFLTLRGSPDYTAVTHLALGGENENCEVVFYFTDQSGKPLLS